VDNLLLGRRFVDDDFAVLQVDRHGEIIRLLLLLVVRVFRRKGSETCQRGPVKGKMVRITNSWLRRDIVTFPNIDLLWRRTGEDDHPGFPTSFFRSDNEKATNHAIHTGTVLFLHVESHDVAILIRLSRSRICLRRVRPATSDSPPGVWHNSRSSLRSRLRHTIITFDHEPDRTQRPVLFHGRDARGLFRRIPIRPD